VEEVAAIVADEMMKPFSQLILAKMFGIPAIANGSNSYAAGYVLKSFTCLSSSISKG
jgi:hypothetical protein